MHFYSSEIDDEKRKQHDNLSSNETCERRKGCPYMSSQNYIPLPAMCDVIYRLPHCRRVHKLETFMHFFLFQRKNSTFCSHHHFIITNYAQREKKKVFCNKFFCIYFFEQNFTSEEQECMYANTRVTETSIKRIQSFIIWFVRRILIDPVAILSTFYVQLLRL